MHIRWLGAFRRPDSVTTLGDSLAWELGAMSPAPVCAETIVKGVSYVYGARVGLLVKNRAIIRRFKGDVWSEVDGSTIRATRTQSCADSDHREAWVRQDYAAIVITTRHGLLPSTRAMEYISEASDKYGIEVLVLNNKKLCPLDRVSLNQKKKEASL